MVSSSPPVRSSLERALRRYAPVSVELVDGSDGGRKVLTSNGAALWFGAALSADGRFVAFDDFDIGRASVIDVASGETVLSFESTDGLVRAINEDGSLLAYGEPIEIRDVPSGEATCASLAA